MVGIVILICHCLSHSILCTIILHLLLLMNIVGCPSSGCFDSSSFCH